MDAKEMIGRAVAKVTGECWHEWESHDEFFYFCKNNCGLNWGIEQSTADALSPDYTSEAYIRKAVMVLLGDDKKQWGLFFGNVLIADNPTVLFDDNGMTFEKARTIFNAPKEEWVKAILPIAQEILEQPTGAGGG